MEGKKKTVLVCDDEDWVCQLLQDYLEGENYNVITVHDLKSARDILRKPVLPDVLVQDVMLPDGNGLDFLAELRSAPHTKSLPIIVVTAHRIQTQDMISGFDLGADDYLIKPFDLKELKSRIERLLKRVEITQKEEQMAVLSVMPVEEKIPKQEMVELETKKIKPIFNWRQITGLNCIKKYFKLLFYPQEFLEKEFDIDISFSVCLLGIFALGQGIQQGILEQSIYESIRVTLLTMTVGVAFAIGISFVIFYALKRKIKPGELKSLVYYALLGFAPLSVASILGIINIFLTTGHYGDLTAGPLLFFPYQSSSSLFGFWLRHIDVFEIWGVVLATMSITHHLNLGKGSFVYKSVSIWLVLIFFLGFFQ